MEDITPYNALGVPGEQDVDAYLERRQRELLQLETQLKQNIFAIGQKLTEVQAALRHNKRGGFEAWLRQHLGWSKQTAYNFIHIYEHCQDYKELDIPYSTLALLGSPSTPKEARSDVREMLVAGTRVSFKVAKQLVRQYRDDITRPSGTKRIERLHALLEEADDPQETNAYKKLAALIEEKELMVSYLEEDVEKAVAIAARLQREIQELKEQLS